MTEYSYSDTTSNKILDLIKGFSFGITKDGTQMTISTEQIGMLVYWVKLMERDLSNAKSREYSCGERIDDLEEELRRIDPENKILGDVIDADDLDGL